MSKTKYGFIRFDSIDEFKKWLNKKSVSRKITRLQVHHTYLPCYDQWPEDELTRQKNMRDYHVNNNGWADIAQHFTIFPNGKIVTGRSLENTPVGIKGWNTYAICIEIYGNFDKNKDVMKSEQKKAIIACYALLCKKFGLSANSDHIRAHSWFTSGGTYLGGYYRSKSCKTCPGTNFTKAFGGLVDGYGNTKDSFNKYFYPAIKSYMNGNADDDDNDNDDSSSYSSGIYRVKVDDLNIRKGPGTSYDVVGTIKDKGSYTITKISGSWGYLKSGVGWINISTSYCEKVENSSDDSEYKTGIYRVIVDTLNIRKEPGTSYDVVGAIKDKGSYTITKISGSWGYLKSEIGWINISSKYCQKVK